MPPGASNGTFFFKSFQSDWRAQRWAPSVDGLKVLVRCMLWSVRARFHCGKQNAKRCVFMTVARQICILEYGVSLSCKRGLKRTQTKTGVSEGGGEKIHANVNAAKRELRNTLFFSKKTKVFDCHLSQRFSRRHWLLSANGEFVRKLLWSRNYENVSLSSFHAAHAENRKRTELVFRVEATFSETWPKRNHVKKRARFS